MGDMADDADAFAEAREGYYDVRVLLERGRKATRAPKSLTRVQAAEQRMVVAKAAFQDSRIACPMCGKAHIKTTYNKLFCSNGRTKLGGNCKDDYHNLINPR